MDYIWKKKEKKGVLDKVYTKLFPQNENRNLNNIIGRPDFGSVDGVEKILKNMVIKNIETIRRENFFIIRMKKNGGRSNGQMHQWVIRTYRKHWRHRQI